MRYIDLDLRKHEKQDYNHYSLSQIIQEHKITVLLGSPGSGKTSILEKYNSDNKEKAQFLKVKKFLKLDNTVRENIDVLLLDGLDEYRSVTSDKSFVLTELGHKINQLENIKVVISCREMDWYGETDSNALKDEISEKANIYSVLPLYYKKQVELAKLLKIEDTEKFINKFTEYGFLDNPQMFTMLADMYKNDIADTIGSKADLYLTFLKNAREKNVEHSSSEGVQLEVEDILKYVGYIASYYMLSGIDELDDDFVDNISSTEKGYSRDKIEKVLKTTLFQDKRFIHRTIAEFSLAYFLANYKLNDNNSISIERVKNLFINNGRVPTELRGTYAWLCSITGNEEFIKVDPYYQAVHGDNSLYDSELKKRIVLEVKEYSIKNPYFFEFSQTMQLEGFYNEELDTFFIEEFKEALNVKTHYIYFIIHAIVSSNNLSSKMIDFLQKQILDNNIPSYLKDDMLSVFHEETIFLIDTLDKIKDGLLEDKADNFKEALLKILYPSSISIQDISPYLQSYQDKIGGHCHYLFKTPYSDKYTLVDNIYASSYNEEAEPHLRLPYNIESFIEDYYLETLLKYEDGLDAEEIYQIIKHFEKYHKWHENLRFQSYRYEITDRLKLYDEKLVKLTNELFEFYMKDVVKKEDPRLRIYNFNYFFNYKEPTNQSKVLFSTMHKDLDPEINKELFLAGLTYSWKGKDRDTVITNQVKDIATKFKLKVELHNWLHPKKHAWEVESEKRKMKKQRKDAVTKALNEKHFAEKRDIDIQSSFADLHYITNLFYIKKERSEINYLEEKTVERVKYILKKAIYSEPIDSALTTIESLAKSSPEARRYIDSMYYVSFALNDSVDTSKIDIEFLKYLYIITLAHRRTGNIIETKLLEQVEQTNLEFVKSTLQEYIELLLKYNLSESSSLIMPYIKASDDIESLKIIAESYGSNLGSIQNNILDNFLNAMNFNIKIETLNALIDIEMNEENKTVISALKIFAENKKDDFNINMAIALHSLFKYKMERFTILDDELKVKIIDYMIFQFNTEDSIKNVNGVQSGKPICGSFLRSNALNILDVNSLKNLYDLHLNDDDIWMHRIAHKINELGQKDTDQSHKSYSLEKVKNFILSDDIMSNKDFFIDVCLKLEKLKVEIEDNRNNDKDPFYSQVKGKRSKKTEEACRDVIMHRLKDKYGNDLDLTKEKHESNNRVDLNIKYRANSSYEIQVECKRDDNSDINKGIPNQLVAKYFSSGVQYGVYLIFYFGDKKNKDLLLKKIDDSISSEYIDNIKVICMDLTFPEVGAKE